MKAKVTWVLVADGARARILARKGAEGGLEQIPQGAFVHEVNRVAELGTDRPGRGHESANPAHHAIEPRVDWRREGKHTFAHRLADFLEQKAVEKAFDCLILVAPPHFIGDLRDTIGREARVRLVGELTKDLTRLPPEEIDARLVRGQLPNA
ncbi:MAG: host attachment protein [Hyphomicrobiales bacterium]